MTIVYVRYMNRSLTVILSSQNEKFIYSVYRLSFSIFTAWQAQNLKCAQHSYICAERNRIFQQTVVVLQLPLFCIYCQNIRSSEIAFFTGRTRNHYVKTRTPGRLKQSDISPVYYMIYILRYFVNNRNVTELTMVYSCLR